MAKRNDTEKLDALLASVTDDMLGEDFEPQFRDDSIKVERILLDLAEIVRQIVDFNLTSRQVKELCEGDGAESENQDNRLDQLPASVVKLAKIT